MNSKLIILLLILCGCGVKSAPLTPPGSELPSYTEVFLDEQIWANPNSQKSK
ncbi:MAG: hypothetical protein OEY33_01925 [Bdellovibrionales bacterium]|nr:hypothetical protein [Bdellovibrionales bacterium]